MLKRIASRIMLTLLLMSMLSLAFNIQLVKASGTIYVRADGSVDPPTALIQRDGDLYTLTGNITTSIEIERNNMTLNGMNYTVQGYIAIGKIGMERSNITVKNIRVVGSGIYIHDSTEISVVETIVLNGGGIRLFDSHNNKIVGNRLENNYDGMRVERSYNNTIMENFAVGNRHGFWIRNCANNTIIGNTAIGNERGLWLDQAPKNTLRNNNMSGNQCNFGVHSYDLAGFIHDIDTSNVVDDKAIYYFLNEKDLVINSSTTADLGYLAFVNSTNIKVQNLSLTNNGQGVLFAFVTNSTIEGCRFASNLMGIELRFSDNNLIAKNVVINNRNDGIHVWDWLSSGGFIWGWKYGGNTITRNTATGNGGAGIVIWYADCNNVTRNTVTSNGWAGISLRFTNGNPVIENEISTNKYGIHNYWSAHNYIVANNVINSLSYALHFEKWSISNTIFHNNFINNTEQVYVHDNYYDVWDDGYPSGGNHWSDYNGTDLYSGPYQNETGSDGIGDTPYVIDENNVDRYPFKRESGWEIPTPEQAIRDLINIVESMNLQQGIDNSLDAKLTAVLNALEALNADQRNDAINKLNAFINEVEAQRGKKLTEEQADTLIIKAQEIISLIEG